MTPEQADKRLDEAEIAARKTMVEVLGDEEFQRIAHKGPAFHDVLMRAHNNGWVHYTRLAHALGISASQVNRWFKPSDDDFVSSRSTPNKFVIDAALSALKQIMEDDMRLLKKHAQPIGREIVAQMRPRS